MNFVNVLLRVLGFVPTLVTSIENMCKNKGGAEKKDAALTFLSDALNMIDAVANKDVVDAEKFRDGISKIVDGTVECLNASSWAKNRPQASAVSHQ